MEIPARMLWEEKKFDEAVMLGINLSEKRSFKNHKSFSKYFLTLAYSLYSASELKLYDDIVFLFPRINAIIRQNPGIEPPIGWHNYTSLIQNYLMSLVFQACSGSSHDDKIKKTISLLQSTVKKTPDPGKFKAQNELIIKLTTSLLEGQRPYYTEKVTVSSAVPLPTGSYNPVEINEAKWIKISRITNTDISPKAEGRYFSNIELCIDGFINTDHYWRGPNLSNSFPYGYNRYNLLKITNELILHLKRVNPAADFAPFTYDDLGRVITTQYCGDGTLFHHSIALL